MLLLLLLLLLLCMMQQLPKLISAILFVTGWRRCHLLRCLGGRRGRP
jgi:hypothetical protein